MAIGDIWEINQEWRFQAESALVRGHFREEQGSEPDLEQAGIAIAAFFDVHFTSTLSPQVSDEAEMICTTAKRVNNTGSRVFTFFGAGQTGAQMGPPIQAGEAVLASKYTNVNSPSTRGRAYLPWISATHKLVNQVLQSSKLLLTVLAEELLRPDPSVDVPSVGDMCGVVWSEKLKTGEDITNIDIRPVLASQRGRVERHQNFSQ